MSIINDFTVFHVGGKGGYGEAGFIFKRGKDKIKNMNLLIFEADVSDDLKFLQDNKKEIDRIKKKRNIDIFIYPYCLSDHIGKETFYINKDSWSSSLFLISEKAKKWSSPGFNPEQWVEHCSTFKEKIVDVTTFDGISNSIGYIPDMLDMDVQGSELSVLKGSLNYLSGDLLSVLTEVEFQELYEKQPLFSDQAQFLKKYDFMFIDLLETFYFYPGKIYGKGFLTVGVALFLRDYNYFIKKYENDLNKMFKVLLKLIWISVSFRYLSYADIIISCISDKYKEEWNRYIESNGEIKAWLEKIFTEKIKDKKMRNKI